MNKPRAVTRAGFAAFCPSNSTMYWRKSTANMIRVVSSLLLALMLALTSQSMAVARGASAATGQMVLCTGTGPVAVYVDAQGQPTSAPHICPDSAFNVLFELRPPVLEAPTRLVVFVQAANVAQFVLPAGRSFHPPARAPPSVV